MKSRAIEEPTNRALPNGSIPVKSPPSSNSQFQINARDGLIDGWRGISVLLVIIGHVVSYRMSPPIRPLSELGLSFELLLQLTIKVLAPIGQLGVQIFFVISGYLITSLLLKEETSSGRISITCFYIRRACRIVPAFACLLFILLILRAFKLIEIPNEAFIRSVLFVCNISEFKCSWWLAHTWSLSVEEQFYLAWPLLFVLIKNFRAIALAAIVVTLMLGSLHYAQFSNFAHIAIGALYAASPETRDKFSRISKTWIVILACSILLLNPLMPGKYAVLLSLKHIFHTLEPLLTALVFFATVSHAGPKLTLIRVHYIQKIGLASYSLYLWQQVGTAPTIWNGTVTGSTALYSLYLDVGLLCMLTAIISYIAIERPFIALGRALSDKWTAQGIRS